MFCKNCGQQLPDDAKFCPACGDRVAETATVKPATAKPAAAKPKKNRKKGKKALRILLIVLAALLLIGGALLLYTTRKVAEVPDPADFFGLEAQPTTSGFDISWMFMSDEDPYAAFEAYVDYIEQHVDGLRLKRTDWSDSITCDFVYTGFWPGDAPQFRIIYKGYVNYSDEVGYTYLIDFYSDPNFTFVDCEPFSGGQTGNGTADSNAVDMQAMQQEEPQEQRQDEPAAVSGLALPDIDAFLGYAPPSMDEPANSGGWHKYYELSMDPGWLAGTEYVQLLLNDSRFELWQHFDETIAWLYQEYYFFDYIGEELTPVQDQYILPEGYQDFSADVFIRLERNGQYGISTINIFYSSDLNMQDFGHRASMVPQGSSGSDGMDFSYDEPYKPDGSKLPCITCDGDGDCTRCNGYGTIERYSGNGETVTSSCPDCNRSGNCRTCGGSGTRE